MMLLTQNLKLFNSITDLKEVRLAGFSFMYLTYHNVNYKTRHGDYWLNFNPNIRSVEMEL